MKTLCFGEVLFDSIEGQDILGGAPLNVAGHISQLGGEASVISAIGNDELGRIALKEMNRLGVSNHFVEVREKEGTGLAIVTLSDGIPDYSFTEPSAWDYIDVNHLDKDDILRQGYDCFVFGTLASRREMSRSTLYWILDNIPFRRVLFDINLRKEFYSKEVLEKGCRKATILKMNDEELPVFARIFGLEASLDAILKEFCNLELIVMTEGAKGLSYATRDQLGSIPAVKSNVIDTVGAGDSIAAALLDGLDRGLDVKKALVRASLLSSFVVGKRGAIPLYDDEILKKLKI